MDEDVLDALKSHNMVPVDFQAISRRSPTGRQVWRVTLTDGRIVKARRAMTEEQARKASKIVNGLSFEGFSRVLALQKKVVIEEWFEGSTLEQPTRIDLEQSARSLRRFHDSQVVRQSTTAPHLDRILKRLPLAGLESSEPRLRKLAPEKCRWGLIHGDFCGSNLVRVDSQRIFCIDNEWQREGPILYDLARTLTLWQLNPTEETWFLEAYYGPDPVESPDLYWILSALVESIHNRRKGKLTSVDLPLKRLNSLLEQNPETSESAF